MKFLRDGHLGAALPYRKRNSTGGFSWFQSGGTLVFSRILFYGPEMIHEWDPQQWDESAIKADLKTFGDVEIFWYDDDGGVADRLPLSEIHRLMTDRRRVDYQQPKDTTYTFQVREEVPGGRLDVEADKPEPASITTTSSDKAPETDMAASASKPIGSCRGGAPGEDRHDAEGADVSGPPHRRGGARRDRPLRVRMEQVPCVLTTLPSTSSCRRA